MDTPKHIAVQPHMPPLCAQSIKREMAYRVETLREDLSTTIMGDYGLGRKLHAKPEAGRAKFSPHS